ncbi:hypothetical protein [Streptomyces sp. NBC_01408]|uniref:hypothetical protein n=1 Tax=Streptomyces sp. NBC_01408 TaxID=2903855 RepID=UPI0022533E31|nr:hypothetical protein [Streptomyces sp. NBC_01408]MCX4695036.1 hypothetical protein [Streptomyces sp. NBC_01408]
MKLMPYSLGVLPLTLLALLAPPSSAVPAGPAAPSAPGAVSQRHSAAEISRFLAAFYGDHGPSPYDRENRVSQVLKERQGVSPGSDVLLCAQNKPRAIGVGPVTVAPSAGVGWATVTTHWGAEVAPGADARAEAEATDTFTAYVRLDSRPIRLDDVICAG